MLTYKLTIYGKVQGVSFRYYIKKKADSLNIKGYVKNKESGTVETILQGEENPLKEMINFCKKGPFLAKVENTSIEKIKTKKYKDFKVLF